MFKKATRQAFAIGVMLAVTPVLSAHALGPPSQMTLRWSFLKDVGKTIKMADKLYKNLDAASKMATGDVPGLMSDSFELQAREQRARRFKVQSQPPAAPRVEGDRVFSKDIETRQAARQEWADFVDKDLKFLENLKERRAQQADRLDTLERQYDSLSNLVNELPDLIQKVSQAIPVNVYYVNKLGELQLTAEQNVRTGASLVDEFRRIVREYDRLIEKVSVDHEAHVATLHAIDAIQGTSAAKDGSTASSATAAPAVHSTPTVRSNGVATISKEVGSAVDQASGSTTSRAYELQTHIETVTRNAPPPPAQSGSQTPTVAMPTDRREHDYELQMWNEP
ncbi:hypothetical protein [Mesorhizobium temperatum]|uniref:Uncharacterized protein n=1 Tax=Mesorhizobium temperatum TaxID=241416 RepID=A0A271LMK7_9HYPH|nr:hypothetical protein [Mesorhizobium temperatum]PAQ09047.1 hypothetical protein CIT26_14140 [Mesorhizobium temperatum]